MDRRKFLKSGMAAAMANVAFAGGLRVSANDKVTLAVIGVRGRGRGLAEQFAALPDVNLAYLCDVDERVFGPVAQAVERHAGKPPQEAGGCVGLCLFSKR